METFGSVVFVIVVIVVIIYFKGRSIQKANEEAEIARLRIQTLKTAYDLALKGTDKQKAIAAGRAYYGAMRGGSVTIYDETAITNDVLAMNV